MDLAGYGRLRFARVCPRAGVPAGDVQRRAEGVRCGAVDSAVLDGCGLFGDWGRCNPLGVETGYTDPS